MSKSKAAKVSRIEIEIGDKKLGLSLDEARELKQLLSDLLGDSKTSIVEVIREHYPVWPYPHWYYTYTVDGSVTIASTKWVKADNDPPYTTLTVGDSYRLPQE